jgi:cytochrome c-type biogenesis protein CcsB
MNTDMTLFWVALGLYGLSAFAYIFGLIAKSEKLFVVGRWSATLGFVPHVSSIIVRWTSTGLSPFFTIAESITFAMFAAVLVFIVVGFVARRLRPLGVLVMPVAFVLMGWAGTLMQGAASQVAPALQSGWIWVHIVGAATGFSSVLIAAGLALLYLLKERSPGRILERVPEPKVLDEYEYRFVLAGFIMYGVMIVSGCFWANQVKGIFWNWDPVEVWSLVSWLTYGVFLHLRITMGWRGRRLAIYSLFAMFVMIISYWGIPFSVETFHSGFRIEH